jgi:pimeloyl-ACP methyl ester carboxylesterase
MHVINRILATLGIAAALLVNQAAMAAPVKNIVLVHGFFADGSGWRGVAEILMRDGFSVSVVQQPETSFEDDVKAIKRTLDALNGDSILVGHSYGGALISEAGVHAKVVGLVYVAAYLPDVGETLRDMSRKMPSATKGIKSTADGYLYFDPALFHADFAADLPEKDASFMAIAQVMPAAKAANTALTQAAWKTKPSWVVVSGADRTINPDLQRYMAKRAGSTVAEIAGGSHATFIVHPAEVAKVIKQAAAGSSK